MQKLLEVLKLRGMKAEYMNFPDRSTAVGSIINDYLSKRLDFSDEAIHLLFSANRWELAPIIKQKLESGVSLIVDRYSYSGVAFSAAKEGMDIKWCWNPEIGLPEPDAVFYLTLSEDAASKRGGFGNERYELSSFQRKVQSNYLRLKDSLWQVIDADKDAESLHHEILDRFLAVHKATADNPLRSLEELSVNLD